MIYWFPAFACKCNACRYDVGGVTISGGVLGEVLGDEVVAEVGLNKLNGAVHLALSIKP